MTIIANIQLSDGSIMERAQLLTPAADFTDNIQQVFDTYWIKVLLDARPMWVQTKLIALIEPVTE